MKKITREELIEKLASLELRKFIEYYEGASDINDSSSGRRERGNEGGSGQFQKFFLSVGELDGFDKKTMLRWLNDCGLGNVDFGKIRIHRTHTFVEADSDSTQRIMDTLNKQLVNDRKVRVELQGMSEDGFTKRKKPGDRGKPGDFEKRGYYSKDKNKSNDKKKFKKRY
jgi:hypothetical protein